MDLDYSKLPAPMRARLEHFDGMPALAYVRDQVAGYFNDADSLGEAYALMCLTTPFGLRRHLAKLDDMLGQDLPRGTLTALVAHDFNQVIDDNSDEGSRRFLTTVADMLRRALDEVSGA